MKEGLVSIITPMYKSASFVGKTVESVIKQTYSDWEMIIVDDCSPDNGAGIKEVKKYNDSRIRLIESKTNSGSSGARNIALREAQGRFIAFLDSDDIWCEKFLEEQLSFMKLKNAPLVFSSHKRIDEDTEEEISKPFIVPAQINYKTLLKVCPIFPSTVIYDTGKLNKTYFNEAMGSLRDDYVYWLGIMKKIEYAYGNKKILAAYRVRKASVTANKTSILFPHWKVLRQIEKLSVVKSIYYMACFVWYSCIK